MTEYVRTSQLQIQRLSEMTEACHREVVQMRAISIDAVSAVASGQWSGSDTGVMILQCAREIMVNVRVAVATVLATTLLLL